MGEKYHMQWIELEKLDDYEVAMNDLSIQAFYNYDKSNNTITRLNSTGLTEDIIENNNIWVIKKMSNPYYIDILNHQVVKAFIDSTYKVYYDRFADEFGKGLKGFFTDEPQYSRSEIPEVKFHGQQY